MRSRIVSYRPIIRCGRYALNTAVKSMDRQFAALYIKSAHDSIAPEKMLSALMHGLPPPANGSKNNPEVNFRSKRRAIDTHESATYPNCWLLRKSKKAEAIPAYVSHVLMEKRSGLVLDRRLTQSALLLRAKPPWRCCSIDQARHTSRSTGDS